MEKLFNDAEIKPRRLVKILSIDGGGIRGIIPAKIISELQDRINDFHCDKKIYQCFDIIAGTSVGGIIALMLTCPGSDGKNQYSAKDIYLKIKTLSKTIFSRSTWQIIKSGNGILSAKYDASILEGLLRYYFGDKILYNALTDVYVPAYCMNNNKTLLFNKTFTCLKFSDIARCTSAAPTYFVPYDLGGDKWIDGGVSVNNPALAAVAYAKELYGDDIDLIVVSLGTGTISGSNTNAPVESINSWGVIKWAKNAIDIMLSSENSMAHYELKKLTISGDINKYYRMQPTIDPVHFSIDDASDSNIAALDEYAEDLIYKHRSELDDIAKEICV